MSIMPTNGEDLLANTEKSDEEIVMATLITTVRICSIPILSCHSGH
jgi:hypothetical protein